MNNLDLRPLSVGEILDRTFTIYRNYFVVFIGISAIPQLLVLALNLAQVAVWRPRAFQLRELGAWPHRLSHPWVQSLHT